MELKPAIETLKGEGLKTAAEVALHGLSRFPLGERLLETYAHGLEGRIRDPRLNTSLAGMDFDHPIMVGPGWDKKGRAVRGLYSLGYSAVENGTVPLLGQPGSMKPRMGTVGPKHSVGWNRLGFNSPGAEAVERSLGSEKPFPCHVGINIGKNKVIPDELSPWAHAEATKILYNHASYFVFNPSSPNTPGLRGLQKSEPLRAHISAMQQAMEACGGQKPFFVKFAPDITMDELGEALNVLIEMGVNGAVLVNTTVDPAIKAKYGMNDQMGGFSGNEWEYRSVALRMMYEAYEMAGDKLELIGVGGISTAEHAIDRMRAGASLLQVVTAIRPSWGRAAVQINRGILDWMDRHNVQKITEIIGAATKRGSKYPKPSDVIN